MKFFFQMLLLITLVSTNVIDEGKTIRVPIDPEGAFNEVFHGRMSQLNEPLPKSWFKGYPDSLNNPQFYKSTTQLLQNVVNEYSLGYLDSKKYAEEFEYFKDIYSSKYHPATMDFIPSDIFFLVAKSSKGDTILGVDPTLDYDFSDGQYWLKPHDSLSFEDKFEGSPTIEIHGKYWNNSVLESSSMKVKMGLSYFPPVGDYGKVTPLYVPEFQIILDGESINIRIDRRQLLYNDPLRMRMYRYDSLHTNKLNEFKIGDTLLIENHKIVFTEVDPNGKWIEFKDYGLHRDMVLPVESGIAPEIKAVALNGQYFSLKAHRGKYVFLDFWGTWCGPCVTAIPDIKKSYDAVDDKIEFVGLASDTPEKVTKFIKERDIRWTQIILEGEDNEIANLYRVNGYPKYFLIDPEGRVIKVDGELATDIVNYLKKIAATSPD